MKCVGCLIIISSGVVIGADCCCISVERAAVIQLKKAACQSKLECFAC
ncbi:hypothetical protein ECDEC6E_1775 [Escherichia coli DEC6E]|nr:hypothetical protein ECDEC6E_1775 [Escherichia coli DEC6E]